MEAWYTKVMGLCAGDWSDFPFPGAWLYAGDTAVIHLVGLQGSAGAVSEQDLKLEHFAFSATRLGEFETQLRAMKLPFQRIDLLSIRLVQLHLQDPDGNHVHADFSAEE